ncbi:hypothetical protein GGR54DRAFT_632088 [Hypoxylon sp. NC1633]|nr:hypothetical protein GGR54DRAFT_632088 [Hypoxylon sp. NC1633]
MSPKPWEESAPNPHQNTQFHLAALSFTYPPTPWTIKKCTCDKAVPEKPVEQSQHVRLYYAEPSYDTHTPGWFVIKENRFTETQKWHAPSDGLVADDAVAGSPITAVGWWHASDDGLSFVDPWERINRSYFLPSPRDDFDVELPRPEELIPPTPGWASTRLSDEASNDRGAADVLPVVKPHPITKLTSVRTERDEIYLFYQAYDGTIRVLIHTPGKGWAQRDSSIVSSSQIQAGSALTAVAGGWSEIRLFYVTPKKTLGEVYLYNGEVWSQTMLPSYSVMPTTMLAAVAWNYATPFFQIRIYATGGKNEVHEYSFSRESGGWAQIDQAGQLADDSRANDLLAALYPVSAVAACMVGDGCSAKVYFHPRRFVAEWDSCTRRTFPESITTVSPEYEARRLIEHKTRVKIAEEEERKNRAEEERKNREAEEQKRRKAEEAEHRRLLEEEREREQQRLKQEADARAAEEKKKLAASRQSTQSTLAPLTGKDLEKKESLRATPVGAKVELSGTVLEKIKHTTKCTMGYEWVRKETGWQCAGGRHFLTDEQFEAL